MNFADLRLAEPILRAVAAEGYSIPTPIQVQAIPHLLEGRDLLGCAQTGTGKTAAFALPILQRLTQGGSHNARRAIRALILAPTRELATQIGESFRSYGRNTGLRHTVIFGGVSQGQQTQALRNGVDIVVATPGRLLDLMTQRHVKLDAVEVFVLDEADRMLDMGFIHDIRQISEQLPKERQTLLFSATMPTEIRRLANTVLKEAVEVRVAPESALAENVEQFVYMVSKGDKPALLKRLLSIGQMTRTLVFTRTKHGADRLVKYLRLAGMAAEAIHSAKKQSAREKALKGFKSHKPPVLVATDIASRGIDVDAISHVVNYDVPREPESYVHRIGRTGRAGAAGIALSFCDPEERTFLKGIERLIRQQITVKDKEGHTRPSEAAATIMPERDARHLTRSHAQANRPPRETTPHHPHQQHAPAPRHEQGHAVRRDQTRPQAAGEKPASVKPSARPRPWQGGGIAKGPRHPLAKVRQRFTMPASAGKSSH